MSVLPLADSQSAARPAGNRAAHTSARSPELKALPKIRRRQRGLMAGVLMLLIAALGAVLATNIYVANAQYEVVQLTNEHRDLVHQNQALTQQVQFLESPQALSNSAVTIGMVMPATAGTFDLSSGEIVSGAERASSSEVPSSFVSSPTSANPEPSVEVADPAETSASGLLGTGALHTLSQPTAGDNGSGTDAGAQRSDTALRGGTIPAPDLTD
jgi:cell division protein FtsL